MITSAEIKKLQHLTKIRYLESEEQEFAKKFSSVIEMINKLHEIDCDDIEPLHSVIDTTQRLVKDKVTATDISDDLFSVVPQQGKDLAKEVKCFVVPKVVE